MAADHSSGYYPTATVLTIAVLTGLWYSFVANQVPDPYLDEVFHVRQAQVYCSGDFHTWDPKITTPPGLYLVSYFGFKSLSTLGLLKSSACSIHALRLTNVGFLYLTGILAYATLKAINNARGDEDTQQGTRASNKRFDGEGWQVAHTAINICLFPPLFFFSALYYTDVGSLTFVMLCGLLSIQRSDSWSSATVGQVALGILALLFRQTNIFWVGIFPAALAVLRLLGRDQDVALSDKPVGLARIEDYVLTTWSILHAALDCWQGIAITALPYVALIAGFGSFVLWNGGVVLGDKSNHVATIHVPQMLYIWPYMFFFSSPIVIPAVLSSVINRSQSWNKIFLELPRLWVIMSLSALAAIVVHYNTIIHPFTLADNRHYVFYTFRILMKHWSIKYLVTPIYIMCGWIVIRTLGGSSETDLHAKWIEIDKHNASSSRRSPRSWSSSGCHASFVLVWLSTTTLSLVTAPLVEPRYFIIPWVVWRLYVPIQRSEESTRDKTILESESQSMRWFISKVMLEPEARLWMETIWFCIINCVTGYIFLYRTFEWPQEPGKVQRFMW